MSKYTIIYDNDITGGALMHQLAQRIAGVLLFVKVEVAVRICDIGGWLDTWFAVMGELLNIAVSSRYFGHDDKPFRVVEVLINRKRLNRPGVVRIHAADPRYDTKCWITALKRGTFDRRNLLLATLSLLPLDLLGYCNLEIHIESPIPPGASMGTSAAVAIAVIKAVDKLLQAYGKQKPMTKAQMAEIAWRAETEVMGGQSGTQDQYAAALSGGVHWIEVLGYPTTQIKRVKISRHTRIALNQGLITVFVGQHNSSDTHKKVIAGLEDEGQDPPRLAAFRQLAKRALNALLADNLVAFGQVMKDNTEAQKRLNGELVGGRHQRVIDLAIGCGGCLGWKVNGAGGEGGSVTLLFASRAAAEKFYAAASRKFAGGRLPLLRTQARCIIARATNRASRLDA